ncbi:MAG TPA: hypothetical protein VGN56_02710 [Candidatus Paceibacterota bacterium]|jgi:hypothetical protein|nr:hypothetical protein [Candidatus Paceibacterota bacterium]
MSKNTLLAGVVVILLLLGAWGAYAYAHRTAAPVSTIATSTQPVATSSASTPSAPAVPVSSAPLIHAYGSVTLSLGQSAKFADVTITPLSITQDSRCPTDVQCIQAGTVQVSVRIGSQAQTLSLNKAFSTSSDTITLTSVQPAKVSTKAIVASDYRLTFDVEKKTIAQGKCYVGGCSSEICSDQPGAISTCIYRPEFGCYRSATCERQASGACGWTQTPALQTCLANPPR